MEHLAFFNLSQDPFRNDPELEGFYRGAPQRYALRRLGRCVRQGKELGTLIGAAGVGKTMLLRNFFEELDPDQFEAALLVVSRGAEPDWLRRSVSLQLGVETPSLDRADGFRELYQQLIFHHEAGRRVVVLIDEAQLLSDEALAEVRSWMNFEHEERKLLSFLLVGNSLLEARLAAAADLLDRVEVRTEVSGFDAEESRAYLEHRLKRAGSDLSIFESAAIDLVADYAAGIPRRLNALADNALFEAYLAGRMPAERVDVEKAARELPWVKVEKAPSSQEIEVRNPNGDSLEDIAASFRDDLGQGEADVIAVLSPDFEDDEDDAGDTGREIESSLNWEPLAEEEPALFETTPDPAPAPAAQRMLPEEDEIEGLFDSLVTEE